MADQVEELIKEIAAKHGIAVSRDDPIVVLQTVNARLLQDSSKAQQTQLDHYKGELEALALRWSEDANARAQKILNASLTATKSAMAELLAEGAKTALAGISSEIHTTLDRVAAANRDARRIGMLNVAAACITLIAAAVALWAIR